MSGLDRFLGPEVVAAIEALVADRIAEALAAHDAGNGSSPWLTLPEAADRLRVSERTVARLIARKRLRTTRIGRRVLVRADDLDQGGFRDE